jgi:hypothetical protein
MAQNISATNAFTTNYDTGVPEQTDSANIVQALTEYHYGPGYNGTGDPGGMESHLSGLAADIVTHAAVSTSVHGATGSVVGTTNTQTLTNKTLTAAALTNPTLTGTMISSAGSISGGFINADYIRQGNVQVVTVSDTQTLTNKSLSLATLTSPKETIYVTAGAPTASANFDVNTSTIAYYTNSANTNFTLNVRGDGSTTLNSILSTGVAISITILVTNGGTAYYPTGLKVDGSSQTIKWQNGIAVSAGNINSIDSYTFTIIKTAANTYTVLGAQVKFA